MCFIFSSIASNFLWYCTCRNKRRLQWDKLCEIYLITGFENQLLLSSNWTAYIGADNGEKFGTSRAHQRHLSVYRLILANRAKKGVSRLPARSQFAALFTSFLPHACVKGDKINFWVKAMIGIYTSWSSSSAISVERLRLQRSTWSSSFVWFSETWPWPPLSFSSLSSSYDINIFNESEECKQRQ